MRNVGRIPGGVKAKKTERTSGQEQEDEEEQLKPDQGNFGAFVGTFSVNRFWLRHLKKKDLFLPKRMSLLLKMLYTSWL